MTDPTYVFLISTRTLQMRGTFTPIIGTASKRRSIWHHMKVQSKAAVGTNGSTFHCHVVSYLNSSTGDGC